MSEAIDDFRQKLPTRLMESVKSRLEKTPRPVKTIRHLIDMDSAARTILDPVIPRLERFYTHGDLDRINCITDWGINDFQHNENLDPSASEIRLRQLRATRLLLLNQDAVAGKEQADWRGNPLTDIMLLLAGTAKDIPSLTKFIHQSGHSYQDYYFSPTHLYPAILNVPPNKTRLFYFPEKISELYPLQYAEIGSEAVRIIRGHEKFPLLTGRAFEALNFAASVNPHALDSAFAEYHRTNEIGEDKEGLTGLLSVTLLEIMNNTGRLREPQLQPLVSHLVRNTILDLPVDNISQALRYYSVSHDIDWDRERKSLYSRSRVSRLSVPASSAWENQIRAYHSAEQNLEELSSPQKLLMYKIRNGRIPPDIHNLRNTLHAQMSRTEKDLPRQWSTKWIRLLESADQSPMPDNFLADMPSGDISDIGLKILNHVRNYYLSSPERPNTKISSSPPEINTITPEVISHLSKNPLVYLASKWHDAGFRIDLCSLINKDPKSFDTFLKICSADLLEAAYHPRSIAGYTLSDSRLPVETDRILSLLSQLSDAVPHRVPTFTQLESLEFTHKLTGYLASVPDSLPITYPHKASLKNLAAKIADLKPLDTPGYIKILGIEFPRGIEYKLHPDLIENIKQKTKIAGTIFGALAGIAFISEALKDYLLQNTNPEVSPVHLTYGQHLASEYNSRLPGKELTKPQPVLFANTINPPDSQTAKLLAESFWPLNPTQPNHNSENYPPAEPDKFQTVQKFISPPRLPGQSSFIIRYMSETENQLSVISPPDGFNLIEAQVMLTGSQSPYSSPEYYRNPMGQLISEQFVSNYEPLVTLKPDLVAGNHSGKRIPNMGEPYSLFSDRELSEIINSTLSADPELQQLHRNFITDLQNSPPDKEFQSEIIIKHLNLLHNFIYENHYYSLSTPDEINGHTFPVSLELLSHIRNISGFRCEIAAAITNEWLFSAGVDSDQQFGFKPIVKNNSIWIGWGHVRNVVHLPDGSSYIVDNTPPPKPGLTPAEDLAILQQPEVTTWDELKADAGEISAKTVLGVGAALTAALAVYRLRPGKTRQGEAVEIVRTIFTPEKSDPDQPPLDESEITLLSDIMLYLSVFPRENISRETESLITSLSQFPTGSSKPKLGLLEFLTRDDRSFPAFMEPDPARAFDLLAMTYGSEIVHPSMPPQISSALALREAEITRDPDTENLPPPRPPVEFQDLYNLTSVRLIAESEKLRQHILSQLSTTENKSPRITEDQNRQRLDTISTVLSHHLESLPPGTRNYKYLDTLLRLCRSL